MMTSGSTQQVVARSGMPPEDLARIAARIRQIGVDRVLYGSERRREPCHLSETRVGPHSSNCR
jgi:hypothetical protein